MPVPTDTLWNIKRLNKVFAASSIILLGVIGWTVLQDYDKGWREPQRQGKVWEAALVDEKITRELTPEVQKQANQIDAEIQKKQAEIDQHDQRYKEITAELATLENQRSDIEFRLNNLKSEVGVLESNLQDAITANQPEQVKKLRDRL